MRQTKLIWRRKREQFMLKNAKANSKLLEDCKPQHPAAEKSNQPESKQSGKGLKQEIEEKVKLLTAKRQMFPTEELTMIPLVKYYMIYTLQGSPYNLHLGS